MLSHSWPGNLRELRNAVERAVILAIGPVLTSFDLGLSPGRTVEQDGSTDQTPRVEGVDFVGGSRAGAHRSRRRSLAIARAAARNLDIDATTLQRKRKRYGLI